MTAPPVLTPLFTTAATLRLEIFTWSLPAPVLTISVQPDVCDAEIVKPEMVSWSLPLPRFTMAVPAPMAEAATFKFDRLTKALPGPKTLTLIAPTADAEPLAVTLDIISV